MISGIIYNHKMYKCFYITVIVNILFYFNLNIDDILFYNVLFLTWI